MKIKNKKFKITLLIISFAIVAIFASIMSIFLVLYNKYDLNIDKLTSVNNGIKVYSSSGNDTTLYNTNRSIIEIETLPEYVKNAFIDIEDKRFYSHNGYDLKRIVKSALVNMKSKNKSQGASTISQQLIKNTLLTNEKTYKRKIKEIILAIKMEKQFTKEEILEMYLNTIYFGSNAYGIENASRIYFNKSARDLSINESCCLAGIIKSPKHYSPLSNYNNSMLRKNLIAKQLYLSNDITLDEYNEVKNSAINISKEKLYDNSYEQEAIYEASRLLNLTERELINRKYQIITFKDDKLQKEIIEANKETINSSQEKTNSSLDSLSIVSNNDGEILAYYCNSNYNLHNLIRQPASTLKPLAVYLPCFEHNILTPASMILDEQINYSGFQPQNADKKFHGYVSCRTALSQSLNIPAVKALDYLGINKSKETLQKLGINISYNDLNLGLSLGALNNGVNLLDLFSAYLTLSNLGYHNDVTFVNKILDSNNQVVYSHENYSNKVVSEDACFLVNDILKDCAINGTAKRLNELNIPVASKTGTASNEKGNTDLYNIAYTTKHAVLTWIADIDKSILPSSLLSSSQPTDINKKILSQIYSETIPNDFIVPDNICKSPYDLIELETTNKLVEPTDLDERYIAYDYFKKDNLPRKIELKNNLSLELLLSKNGANLTFNTRRDKTYKIFKETKKGPALLKIIKESNGPVLIKDSDIFIHDEIKYFITDENNKTISDIKTIRPKDYLITLINNQILSGKKKWLV